MPGPTNRAKGPVRKRIVKRNIAVRKYNKSIGGTASQRKADATRTSRASSGPPSVGVPQWDLFRGIGDAIKKATGGRRSMPRANDRARMVANRRSAVQRGTARKAKR